MVSRSRTMATRMIGGFNERDTCLETEAIRMSLCTLRTPYALRGQLRAGAMAIARRALARRSIAASLTIAREDQVACPISAKGVPLR